MSINNQEILSGILIGGIGGASAGILLSITNWIIKEIKVQYDKRKIFSWIKKNVDHQDPNGHTFRSSKAIASYNNYTIDRVNYICSIHPKIKLSTGTNDWVWTMK